MKLAAKKNKILSAIMTCVLAITLMAGFLLLRLMPQAGQCIAVQLTDVTHTRLPE